MRQVVLAIFLLAISLSGFSQGRKDIQVQHYPRLIVDRSNTPRGMAQGLFQKHFDIRGEDELRISGQFTDELGFAHDRYQQYYRKVKVEGAVYTTHSRNNIIESLSGEFKGIRGLAVVPAVGSSQAFQAALNHVNASVYAWDERVRSGYPDYQKPNGELVIIGGALGDRTEPRLAWKFDIYAETPLYRAEVYIDAQTGSFLHENLLIHTTNAPSSGKTIFNGVRNFTADYTGSQYRLRQTVSGGGVETYSLNNGTSYTAATDITSATSTFTSDSVANQAHWGAEQTHDYYLTKHSRNSYNNNGAILRSYVHYSTNYVNAYWDGSRMTYGDGNGTKYKPLVSLDICGHEITHGVTQFSANLTYSYESGALNESFSDIFGEMVENHASGTNDWLMGCDIGVTSCGAFRSMKKPNDYGDPDTYKGTYWYAGADDNGGVHYNSGVQNKWFYILSIGENGTNDLGNSYNVTGLGIVKAAKIAYRNLTVYLSSSSNYTAARSGAIQAAIDLYGAGSAEVIATTNAWYAVGVGCEYGTTCITPYCSSAGNTQVDEWIAGVKIGSFQKLSAGTPYTYYSADTMRLVPGSSNSITLTPGFTSTLYPEYWRIWIDYNADRDFDDAGELVYDAGAASSSARTGSITIAAGATGKTRMRVSMKYNAAPASCEMFTYGEVEDYPVLFGEAGPDTQPPSVPVVSNTAKTQTTLDISWTAATDNSGSVTYDVYVNGNKKNGSPIISPLTYKIINLDTATTYAVHVQAIDPTNNSTNSAVGNYTTLGRVTETPLPGYYFETNLESWTPSNTKNAFRATGSTFSYEGNAAALVQGKNTTLTSPQLNLSAFSQLEFKFYFYATGMEAGKRVTVSFSNNGSSYATLGTFTAAASASGTNFSNGQFFMATITTNAASFGSTSRFRFQVNGADATDKVYFDAVTIKGRTNTTATGTQVALVATAKVAGALLLEPEAVNLSAASQQRLADIRLYPNPVIQQLFITASEPVQTIRIFNSDGALIYQQFPNRQQHTLDVGSFRSGFYIAEFTVNGQTIRRKFIRQ